jgi:hypothetical protein
MRENKRRSCFIGCQILLTSFVAAVIAKPAFSIALSTNKLPAIATQVINGQGVFYLPSSGAIVVPRGMNYGHLNSAGQWWSTFDPATYSISDAQSALQEMHASGYNYVRVFLSDQCLYTQVSASDPVCFLQGKPGSPPTMPRLWRLIRPMWRVRPTRSF